MYIVHIEVTVGNVFFLHSSLKLVTKFHHSVNQGGGQKQSTIWKSEADRRRLRFSADQQAQLFTETNSVEGGRLTGPVFAKHLSSQSIFVYTVVQEVK